jgi:hypothetical protein
MIDLAKILEDNLNPTKTDAHSISNIFLVIIIVIFAVSLLLAIFGKGRTFTSSTPSILTSLGILGTFIGIVIGLQGFEILEIDKSIGTLLEGLKTAFITSLAGMAGAIIFKLVGATPIFAENRTSNEIKDVEPKDILRAIISQEQHLVGLRKAISGEEESSLTGQIKLLRSDISDNHRNQQDAFGVFSKELWLNLRAFSEMLSKSATEQVIQALKEVISDFNKNLTEQFGDNFKALDQSVKKLVDWQANYSSQLESMIDQYSEGVKAISDIEISVTSINKETKAIPESMSQLVSIIEVNQHQITELSRHLAAFKEIKEQAVKAIPEMQTHVAKTVDDISASAQKANEGYQLLLKNTESLQESFTDSIGNIQKKLESSISDLVEKQINEMNRSFSAMENEVTKSVDLTGKAVNKQLEMIDSSMTQEVERVMSEMGQALARISGQFTDDYEKLTKAMIKITNS